MTNLFYYELISCGDDFVYMNTIINCAIRDKYTPLQEYQYLISVAKSLGFNFTNNFKLIST